MNTANQTLAERLRFELTPQKWSEFQAASSRPVAAKPKLKQLLNDFNWGRMDQLFLKEPNGHGHAN